MSAPFPPRSPAWEVQNYLASRGHVVSNEVVDDLFKILKAEGYVQAGEVERSVKNILNSISNEIRNRADDYRARF